VLSFFLHPFFFITTCRRQNHQKNQQFESPPINHNLESRSIEFPLIAENGCYEWQSSSPECLQTRTLLLQKTLVIHKLSPVISHMIILSGSPQKTEVFLLLLNLKTNKIIDSGDILQAKSKISKIHIIEILKTFSPINVGMVQVLGMLGYDPEGNVFSTLEGLRFHWKIEQNDNILEFVIIKVVHLFLSSFI